MSDARHDEAVRHLARGGSINLVGTAVAAIFGFLLTWVVARGASLTDAGVFFATTSLFLILVAVAEVGGDASLPRFIPLLRARGRQGEISDVVRLAAILSLVFGVALGVLLLVAHGPISRILGFEEADSLDAWVLVSLAVSVPLAALANVLLAATRGFFSIRATVLIDKIGRTLAQFILVGGAVMVGSLGLMIDAWIAPMALAVIPAAWFLMRLTRPDGVSSSVPVDAEGIGEGERPGETLARAYYRYTWPRAISRLLQMVLQRVDVIVVAAIVSPSAAAIYAVASRLIVLAQAAAMAIQQVLAPRISHLIEDGDNAAAMQLSKITAAWTILMCWPLYLLSISAGPLILTILGGSEYVPGWQVLSIMAAGMLIASATGPVDTVLLMAGRSSLSLGNMVVGLVIDLTLLFWLTPMWGIAGAGIARSAALVVRSLLGVWFVRRITGETAFGRPALAAVVTTVIPFLVIPWVLGLRDAGITVLAALIALLCLAIMGALAWVLRRPMSLGAFRSIARR